MTDYHREFIRELHQMAERWNVVEVFGDAVGMMASALQTAIPADRKAAEETYMQYAARYTHGEMQHMAALMSIVVEALEKRRESFLGPVLEDIGAANTRNGQFLTPNDVAKLMAEIGMDRHKRTPGKIVTVDDPACGAGVTLIAQGEAMLRHGYHQSDILITGGDIDRRACDMTYVELTILGYAGIVRHENALTMEKLSPDRYTFGYFLHGMPMRRGRAAA